MTGFFVNSTEPPVLVSEELGHCTSPSSLEVVSNVKQEMRVIIIGQDESLYRSMMGLVGRESVKVLVISPSSHFFDFAKICDSFGFHWMEEPGNLKDMFNICKDFRPDITLLVFRVGRLLQEGLLKISELVVFHPSLLPKYRGANAPFWAIVSGDKLTGVTVAKIVSENQFEVIESKKCSISVKETGFSLNRKLLEILENISFSYFHIFLNSKISTRKSLTVKSEFYQPPGLPNSGLIDLDAPLNDIDRFIRALYCPPISCARLALSDGRQYPVKCMDEYDKLMSSNSGCL